ncbi:hypothetical protein QFZ77_003892 [Paenibacillus sp. V4I3]|nr:hypothetical protein [Paenibacillus sp. V4I3]
MRTKERSMKSGGKEGKSIAAQQGNPYSGF